MSKLFPNILCANGKYSLLARDNLMQRIHILLSRKQKAFSEFFSSFLKSALNFQHFQKKKMTLIADVFLKLRTPKNMVRSMPKKSRFRGSYKKQHGKRAQTLFKFEGHLFTIFINHWEVNCVTKSLC